MTGERVEHLYLAFVESLAGDGVVVDPGDSSLPVPADHSADERRSPRVRIRLTAAFTLDEFCAAAQKAGSGAEFMWPDATTLECGRRLLATHVLEELERGSTRDGSLLTLSRTGIVGIATETGPT